MIIENAYCLKLIEAFMDNVNLSQKKDSHFK